MFAKLTALVSGGTQLPYDLTHVEGERVSSGWTHHSATSKADKTAVSIFKYTIEPGQDTRRTESARHGIKSLRTVKEIQQRESMRCLCSCGIPVF